MADDLAELEHIAGTLVAALSPPGRRAVLRRMARALAEKNRARIKAQQTPEGAPFAPRRPKSAPVPGRGAASFLYPSGGSGAPRRVILRGFQWGRGTAGRTMTGYDIEARAIRTFFFSKILKWLPVPAEHRRKAGRLRRRGGVRRKALFRGLMRARYLRASASADSFWVGFSGLASVIATQHQEGRATPPAKGMPASPLAARPLLGVPPADQELLLDTLLEHLAKG